MSTSEAPDTAAGHTLPDRDGSPDLIDAVRAARAAGRAVFIQGGGTKRKQYGRRCDAPALSTRAHRGIIRYRPEELILTARAGTPIAELEAAAAEEGQLLPFEAPVLGGAATLGGSLACGTAGPARPWRGSLRDAVLGVRLITGEGQHLRFGGDVIKNVAGYDVSRLQAGALGTLGVITEVSLRLLPRPPAHLHLFAPCPAGEAVERLRAAAARARPLTGAAWHREVLHLRFEGSAAAIDAVRAQHRDMQEGDGAFWTRLREGQLREFTDPGPLWMFDLGPATAEEDATTTLIDWAGARRYRAAPLTLEEAAAAARRGRGSAQRLGAGMEEVPVVPDPAAPLRRIVEGVKRAVDPDRVLNPGRLYPWL